MGARVTITWDGMETVLDNLTRIEGKGGENLVKLTEIFAKDTKQAWKEATPRRKGRLQDEERAQPAGLSFTLESSTFYYPFVDPGHWTPKGWRTKRGYRPAKRRSHVEGKYMTDKAVEFVRQNIQEYFSRFLDGV
jgi:hypothetical protein